MDDGRIRLLVVRGWSEELDPRHPVFLQRLREAGVDVVDVFVPAETSRTFDEWVDRNVEAIEAAASDSAEPLRCLGYCIGGNILGQAASRLADRGRPPDYIGLVDTRVETILQRLEHNIHSRARVPRRIRFSLLLASLGTPVRERFRDVVKAWAVARARTIGSFLTKGPRSLRHRNDPTWHTVRLAYSAMFQPSRLPHHRYVARESVEKYGDLTLNTAAWSRGGSALRIVGGDHFTCLTDPHLDGLVRAIVDDLRHPLPLLLEFDSVQDGSNPRSDR